MVPEQSVPFRWISSLGAISTNMMFNLIEIRLCDIFKTRFNDTLGINCVTALNMEGGFSSVDMKSNSCHSNKGWLRSVGMAGVKVGLLIAFLSGQMVTNSVRITARPSSESDHDPRWVLGF